MVLLLKPRAAAALVPPEPVVVPFPWFRDSGWGRQDHGKNIF